MKRRQRTTVVSKITQTLLSQGESEFADFKRVPDGVSVEDLVAFANTESGGTILVGIEETSIDGAQHGTVKGCDVSDAAILKIVNKAVSCVPPVGVVVYVENLSSKPILRIVVASSESKPHCTPRGVYCCRDGSRNRPLHPGELLKIFLETEARAFSDRFEAAAGKIGKDLSDLEETLETSVKSMGNQLGWTESKLGDTESTLASILAYAHTINVETRDIGARVRALFRQDKREDPVRAAARKVVLDELVKQLSENRAILKDIAKGGALQMSAQGKPVLELEEGDLRGILTEAIAIVTARQEAENYTVEVKSPANASIDELETFATLVAAGGEVANGLRQRLKTASALGFLKYDGTIVGTAALKKPAPKYHREVFGKAQTKHTTKSYPLELGWVYLDPAHRGKKRTPLLIDAVMQHAKISGVFATARISNKKMLGILTRQGFARDGSTYASKQTPNENLALFLRAPKGTSKSSKIAE